MWLMQISRIKPVTNVRYQKEEQRPKAAVNARRKIEGRLNIGTKRETYVNANII